jgi:hypothetical protein
VLWARGVVNPLVNIAAPHRRDVREAIRIAEEHPQGPGSGAMAPRSR